MVKVSIHTDTQWQENTIKSSPCVSSCCSSPCHRMCQNIPSIHTDYLGFFVTCVVFFKLTYFLYIFENWKRNCFKCYLNNETDSNFLHPTFKYYSKTLELCTLCRSSYGGVKVKGFHVLLNNDAERTLLHSHLQKSLLSPYHSYNSCLRNQKWSTFVCCARSNHLLSPEEIV